jgi:hypothetical protein
MLSSLVVEVRAWRNGARHVAADTLRSALHEDSQDRLLHLLKRCLISSDLAETRKVHSVSSISHEVSGVESVLRLLRPGRMMGRKTGQDRLNCLDGSWMHLPRKLTGLGKTA